jgi:hypothetical protein
MGQIWEACGNPAVAAISLTEQSPLAFLCQHHVERFVHAVINCALNGVKIHGSESQ